MSLPLSIGFDLETWGDKQEYALQPFRAMTGEASRNLLPTYLVGGTIRV